MANPDGVCFFESLLALEVFPSLEKVFQVFLGLRRLLGSVLGAFTFPVGLVLSRVQQVLFRLRHLVEFLSCQAQQIVSVCFSSF